MSSFFLPQQQQQQQQHLLIKPITAATTTTPLIIFLFAKQHSTLLFTTTIAIASICYFYLFPSSNKESLEISRNKSILKRKSLTRPQEKYASLKIDKRFVNPFEEWTEIPFYKTVLFWMKRWKGRNGIPSNKKELNHHLPVMKPNLNEISSANGSITFTWFGQSTCLMTMNGITILSDPVFSQCSINDYLGPKRLVPIPCPLEEFMETIDIVIVSHDHFDHLDETVVYKLGNSVTWYIPLGLKDWFLKRGVHNVMEMDWWQETVHPTLDIKIACVPAMHWSGSRTPFEKNNTLWCSYVIQSTNKQQYNEKIFFCGDTGYCEELFQAIGMLYAPFTLAAIPIGSFMPTQLMQHLHMGPEDAIKAHIDLGSPTLSIGIHWGTFMMSDEHYLAPRQVLEQVWNNYCCGGESSSSSSSVVELLDTSNNNTRKVNDTKFTTIPFGQTIIL